MRAGKLGSPPVERCLACEAVVSRGTSQYDSFARAVLYRAAIEMRGS
jgi:hypothetical protein